MLPLTDDCHACIEEFGQRHRLSAVRLAEDPEAPPVRLCEYHDIADPNLTIAELDPHGMLPKLSQLPQLRPKAPPEPPMTATRAEAIIRRTDDLTKHPNGAVYPKLKCRKVESYAAASDHRGLLEVLYRGGEGEPMTAWLRGGEVAYVEDGC